MGTKEIAYTSFLYKGRYSGYRHENKESYGEKQNGVTILNGILFPERIRKEEEGLQFHSEVLSAHHKGNH